MEKLCIILIEILFYGCLGFLLGIKYICNKFKKLDKIMFTNLLNKWNMKVNKNKNI